MAARIICCRINLSLVLGFTVTEIEAVVVFRVSDSDLGVERRDTITTRLMAAMVVTPVTAFSKTVNRPGIKIS